MKPGVSRRELLLLNAGLFVRDHFAEPQLSIANWTLRVEGRVAHPLELTFSDLLESPITKLESVLECAGNGPASNGLGSGVWQGVSIAKLLRDAGADPSCPVLLEGADPYRRIVPQSKCRAPESLVAFKMDDRFLPRANGFPARAILPGWYGMDSVKWLRRIVVLGRDETPTGTDEKQLYYRLRQDAKPERITRILVKSMIAYPAEGAKLPAAGCLVKGYAWTGEGTVKQVDVSVDGGKRWSPAKLDARPRPFKWVEWSYLWPAGAGEHMLMARATDSLGNAQPLTRDPGRLDSYELNWCAPVHCTVR